MCETRENKYVALGRTHMLAVNISNLTGLMTKVHYGPEDLSTFYVDQAHDEIGRIRAELNSLELGLCPPEPALSAQAVPVAA